MSRLSQLSAALAAVSVVALFASTADAAAPTPLKPTTNFTASLPKLALAPPKPAVNLLKSAVNPVKPASTKPATAASSLAQQAAALTRSEHELITVNALEQYQQIATRLGVTVQDAIVLNKPLGPGAGDPKRMVEPNQHRARSSPAYCKNGVVASYGISPSTPGGGVIMNPNGTISGPYTGPAGQIGNWVFTCA